MARFAAGHETGGVRGRRFAQWLVVAVVAAGASLTPAPAAGAALTRSVLRGVPTAQAAAIARNVVYKNLGNPPHDDMATVVRARWKQASAAVQTGYVPPVHGNPYVYAIVVSVHSNLADADGGCKPRSGKRRRELWAAIWIPNVNVELWALISPSALQRLGPRRSVSLAPPRVPASELVLHVGSGIGPVRIGATMSSVGRSLGPALGSALSVYRQTLSGLQLIREVGKLYVIGALEIGAVPGKSGRVTEVSIDSSQATVDGVPLGAGYKRLRRVLGWHTTSCGSERRLIQAGPGYLETSLIFAGNRFLGGTIKPRPKPDARCT